MRFNFSRYTNYQLFCLEHSMDKVVSEKFNSDNINDIDSNSVLKSNDAKEMVYKTKDYVRRAKKNYYNKKKVNDDEFREKERERLRKWREENREQINERARIRRREVKKQKEEKKLIISRDNVVDSGNDNSIDELVVKTENINI